MKPEPVERNEETSNQTAYASSFDHISDELKRLDLLIHLQVLRQRNPQSASTLDPFRGLVLTDEEIADLLNDEGPVFANSEERRLLGEQLAGLELRIRERLAGSLENGVSLSLPQLARIFNLASFEQQCLLICLAPELDRKYEKLYAYLQDDVTRRRPAVDLVMNLLCLDERQRIAARRAFDVQAPLQKFRLLQVIDGPTEGPLPLLSRSLKLDDRIVNYLLSLGAIDARLEPVVRHQAPVKESGLMIINDIERQKLLNIARSHLSNPNAVKQNMVFHFFGPYGSGRRAVAETICRDLEMPLIIADAAKIFDGQTEFEETMWLLGRETVLRQAALCLENFDCVLADDDKGRSRLNSLLEVIQTFSRFTFLLGSQVWKPKGLLNDHFLIEREFSVPDDKERKLIWENCFDGNNRFAGEVDSGELASKFRFTPGQIRDALVAAQNLARLRSPYDGEITLSDLHAACRAQSDSKLGALARKIEPRYGWSDIVLPPDQLSQLEEICYRAKCRHIVYGEWGFDRKLSLGKGLNALFSGPPGTGKTMAAEVIAGELGLDLYKIDLSQVVSKYIGETEKNLHQVFREARASYAILFFDEADALFGKRSEVKDAHDRYANIEIGYLLQKMEEYDGIAILATNLRQNMDEAFVRRLQVIVEFPFPDEEHRRRIWEVSFPRETPLGDDVDFSMLAREIRLAGGNIKNIGLAAAFYAASNGRVIRMPHLLQATRREYQKLGWSWKESEWSRQPTIVS